MPQSIHEHAEDWTAAALAGGLSAEEQRAFDEHLAACGRCRELHAETAAMNEILARDLPPAAGPAPGFETRLVAAFRRRQARGWRARLAARLGGLARRRSVQVAGALAALVALVAVGHLLTPERAGVEKLGIAKHEFPAPAALPTAAARAPAAPAEIVNSPAGNAATTTAAAAAPPAPAAEAAAREFDFRGYGAANRAPAEARPETADRLSSNGSGGGAGTGGRAVPPPAPAADAATAAAPVNRIATATPSARARSEAPPGAAGGAARTRNADAAAVTLSAAPRQATAPAAAAKAKAEAPRRPDRHVRAELEVASFGAAVDAISAAAARDGGRIETKTSARGANGRLGGTLVVKVPLEHLDGFLARLRPLGEIKNQVIQTEDFGSQGRRKLSDVQARSATVTLRLSEKDSR